MIIIYNKFTNEMQEFGEWFVFPIFADENFAERKQSPWMETLWVYEMSSPF